jgi:hypothetical protein
MDANDELVLKPSKLRQFRLLITGAIFTAGGVWMIASHNLMGWFVLLFFGLCLLVFVINLLPNASYLRLTKDGFEVKQLFRSNFYRWTDVQDIQSGAQYKYGFPIRTYVGFNFSDTYEQAGKARAIAKSLTGCEGQLADNFGMEAPGLAALMARWKENACQ